eukprot:6095050-Prorocentrum_lima.AAC.1
MFGVPINLSHWFVELLPERTQVQRDLAMPSYLPWSLTFGCLACLQKKTRAIDRILPPDCATPMTIYKFDVQVREEELRG